MKITNARPAAYSQRALHAVCTALLPLVFCLASTTTGAQTLDSSGNEYILGFNPNSIPDASLELHLTSGTDTFVTVEYPVGSPSFSTTVFVAANGNTVVRLPSSAHSGGTNLARAFAETDFVVYMVNRAPVSSDAALAIPLDALGTEYIVTTYTDGNSPPQFTVFAGTDSTTVTINSTGTLRDPVGNLLPPGTPFNVSLDRGEGAYFYSQRGFEDLTGTIVTADLPVGVINGSGCTYVPPTSYACDHLFEVAQPVASWGREILVTDFPYREPGSIYRILAAEDGTTLLQDGAVVATLDRGLYYETVVLPGSHVFSADKPIFVAQFMTSTTYPGNDAIGDPAMLNAVPTAQYQSSYAFSTVGGEQFAEHFLTVFARTSDIGSVLLDGSPVDPATFTAITDTEFSVAVVPLAEGAHTTSSPTPHGITVEGYNEYDSYVYPGGGSLVPLNDVGDTNPPICTVANLSGPPDYVVGSAEDRRPSEDVNENGALDPGEDANGNGLIDEDTGVASVAINDGSNLSLTVDPFAPGAEQVSFRIDLTDPQQPGSGTVQVLDVAGNSCEQDIEIGASTSESCLEGLAARAKTGKVQLVWRLAGATDSYRIQRGASLDGPFTVIGNQVAGIATFLDSTVANGSLYYYRVSRVDATGQAVCDSDPVAAYVPATRMRLAVVPDLIGQDQGSADAALAGAGLTVGATSTLASTIVPAGQVLSQDPPPSSIVPRGFAVSYAISSGAALVTVPDLVGLPEADALAALNAVALLAGSQTTDNSDTVPEGAIIRQLPVAGTQVNAGSAVSFVVSDGPANKPPVLAAIGDQTVDERELLEFTVSATDPDGDGLFFAIGNPPSNAQLTNRGNGTADFRWTPDDDQTGVFPVSIIVTDNGTPRLTDFEVFTITSNNVNRPPILYAADVVAFEGVAKRFFVTASDLDGDNLVLEATGLPDGAEFVDLGSGTGQFLWTPDVSQIGEHFVEFTVTDDGEPPLSESIEITITVNDINHPPAFDPLGNIIATDVVEFTISATDPDGDTLTITQTGLPADADFVDNGDGTADVSWTPSATGDSWITFTVTDDGSPPQSAALTIRISVVLDITVPDVTGVPLTTAVQAIETAGLAVGSATTEFHPTTPPGWTTDQQPAPGTKVSAGTTVDLTVSLGPAELTVPNVVGFTQANAETTIAAALLVLGTVTEQPSDTVPVGNVISQAPAAGTTVANGSAVDIVVSTGVPNRPPSIMSTPPTLAEVGQLYRYDVEATDPDACQRSGG